MKATGPQHLRRSRLLQLRVRVGRPVKLHTTPPTEISPPHRPLRKLQLRVVAALTCCAACEGLSWKGVHPRPDERKAESQGHLCMAQISEDAQLLAAILATVWSKNLQPSEAGHQAPSGIQASPQPSGHFRAPSRRATKVETTIHSLQFNDGGKLAPTAGRQARATENVHRTCGSGLVACRWRSA